VQTPEGLFYVDPYSNFGHSIKSSNGYESELVCSVKKVLKGGDTFVDMGANEGYYSIIASKIVGPGGTVICIEPQTRLQRVIFRNMLENKAFNINVFQRVIADSIGMANIYLSPDMNTGSSGLQCTTRYRCPQELVPQTTLASLLHSINVCGIKLVKIDVEGFEYEAILGSRDLFASGIIENIALELHPALLARRGKCESDILDFLKECGYERNNDCPSFILSR
jgi:FkbM family methyltransferase